MKKLAIFCIIFLILLPLSGCASNKSRVAEGAIIGGIIGAGAGGIIGHQSHHGAEGAGIGAAAGILTGALIGSQISKPQNPSSSGQLSGGPSANQMSMQSIIDLSKQSVNDAVIIDRIKMTNSRFNLTQQDIDNLKTQGVSDAVIAAMQGK
jgi:hypothetical protein